MAMNYYTKTGSNIIYRVLEGSALEAEVEFLGFTKGAAATSPLPTDLAVPELSQIGVKFKTSADKQQLLDLLAEWNAHGTAEAAQALSTFMADNIDEDLPSEEPAEEPATKAKASKAKA